MTRRKNSHRARYNASHKCLQIQLASSFLPRYSGFTCERRVTPSAASAARTSMTCRRSMCMVLKQKGASQALPTFSH